MNNALKQQGYDAYFARKSYKDHTSVHWMNGWAQAEKDSRGGNFDQYGRPTPCFG